MATDSTEPRVKRPLTEKQVNERRDILAGLIKEKDDIETVKGAETKKWNEQLRLLDEQVTTVACEIRDRAAWIPKQLNFGEDPHAEPVPGASKPKKSGKKKASSRRGSSAADEHAPQESASP